MCGIFGVVCKKNFFQVLYPRIKAAEIIQKHRGPDMCGEKIFEINNESVVYLAHQRLSILDLSDAGMQPMSDRNGENWIVYNGEVYNYIELADYINYESSSKSDTEVIIECFNRFGVENSLKKFNGMWAMAYLSLEDNALYLSRDRAGIKPLYTYFNDGAFYFASEIKTLLVLIGNKLKLNMQTVGEYIIQSLQDASDETFFQGIDSLPAGSICKLDLSKPELSLTKKSYWEPFKSEHIQLDSAKFFDTVREILLNTVKMQLRSDVPVGLLLSGGLDSSVIAACINQTASASQHNIIALSSVSPGQPGDESRYIDQIASHLNIQTFKVDTSWIPGDSVDLLRKATWLNDAPLGSFSNVAFYFLVQKASELGVKVLLSGQGGDELFCGYKKYLAFYLMNNFKEKEYIKLLKVGASFLKTGVAIGQFNLAEASRYLVPSVDVLGIAVHDKFSPCNVGFSPFGLGHRQWLDFRHYSVPYLTHYEDRMSMGYGREVRLPFLDHHLVELMLNAPPETKIFDGWTKYSLRRSFEHLLPKEIVWRRDKQGFSMPQDEWLRGELKSTWLNILNKDAEVFQRKLLNYQVVHKKFEQFCARKRGIWYREIFAPLALEIWLQVYSEFIE